MRMMVAAFLGEDPETAAGLFPELHDRLGIVNIGHRCVCGSVYGDEENTGFDGGGETVGGTQGFGLGVLVVFKLKFGFVPSPIAGTALTFCRELESARPRANVTHAVVEVEDADAVGVQPGPRIYVEATTGNAQHGGFGGKGAFFV